MTGPLHEDWMDFAFDLEVRPPQGDEEYIYKRDDTAPGPQIQIGYGFAPLNPRPSIPVSVEVPNSIDFFNMSFGPAYWSDVPLLLDTIEITPPSEEFLPFAFGPGMEPGIAEEYGDGVTIDQGNDSDCVSFQCLLSRLFPAVDIKYVPGLIPGVEDSP